MIKTILTIPQGDSGEVVFSIIRYGADLDRALEIVSDVFVRELRILDTDPRAARESGFVRDDWDSWAYSIVASVKGKPVGTGRLIWRPPSNLGFRISSSVQLEEFFSETSDLGEISGLAVRKDFRGKGIGCGIHYYRFLLAEHLGAKGVLASSSDTVSRHLSQMGYVTLLSEYTYKRYKTGRNIRVLQFLSLVEKEARETFRKRINERCPPPLLRAVLSSLENEIKRGLDIHPIEA